MALSDIEKNSGVTGIEQLGQSNVATTISKLIPYLIGIAGLFLLFYLVAGGFGIMTSKGDPKAIEAAKAKITTAIIGFVVIAIGYLLVELVGLITGVGNFGGVI